MNHTSREPRSGEREDLHYYSRSREEMEEEIGGGGFLEYAEVHGKVYVTSCRSLEELLDQGKIVLVDVDVQGAKALRAAGLDALFIFIALHRDDRGAAAGAGVGERADAAPPDVRRPGRPPHSRRGGAV